MSTFKKYNVSRPREEAMKDGTTKTFWDNVGNLTLFQKEDGNEQGILELLSFDRKNIRLNVFPFKAKEEHTTKSKSDYSQPAPSNDYSQTEPVDEEEIRVENIPF